MHGTNRNDAVVAPTAALSLSTLQMQTTIKDDVNDIDKEGPDAAIVIYNHDNEQQRTFFSDDLLSRSDQLTDPSFCVDFYESIQGEAIKK